MREFMEQRKAYSGAGLTMPDAYDEKLIAARDYLESAFPEYRISDFAGDEEFLLGVTTRSFRIEHDNVSSLITLTHQFFRDTKATSVIARLRALGVAEAVRSHPNLKAFVLRDRVRLAEPDAAQRHRADPPLTEASRTATGGVLAGADPLPGEDPAVLIDRLRLELQQARAELKALGDQAMVRSDEAVAEIRKLRRAHRRRQERNESALAEAASEREEMRAALSQCQGSVGALRAQLRHDERRVMAEARAIAEQTGARLDEMVRLAAVAARRSGAIATLGDQVASVKGAAQETSSPPPKSWEEGGVRANHTTIAANTRPLRTRRRGLDLLLALVLVGLGIMVGATVVLGNDAMSFLLSRIAVGSAVRSSAPREEGGVVPESGLFFPTKLGL